MNILHVMDGYDCGGVETQAYEIIKSLNIQNRNFLINTNVNQRKILLAKLDRDFPLVEWLLWILNEAGEKWIAEKPLQNLYRCWRRGDDWRQVYASNDWNKLQANRDTYSFADLISQGILELGTWGSEKFYRLSARTRALITSKPEEVFQQFYLMPSFYIVAPAG